MSALDKRVRSKNKHILKCRWRALRKFVTINGDSLLHKKKSDLVRYYCEKKNLFAPENNFETWLLCADLDIDVTTKPKKRKKVERSSVTRTYHEFYDSAEWQTLRRKVLRTYGVKCMKCGVEKTEMHVDHIKPRSKHIELELDFNNLQVLCKACNKSKGNSNEIDYRPAHKIPKTN